MPQRRRLKCLKVKAVDPRVVSIGLFAESYLVPSNGHRKHSKANRDKNADAIAIKSLAVL